LAGGELWTWGEVLRGVQREVVFGAVAASRLRGVEATSAFVEPVTTALIQHPDIAARLAKDPTWSWRPVKEWPDDLVAVVARALQTSEGVAGAVGRMLEPVAARLELAETLAAIGAHLPADTFARMDHDYRVPPGHLTTLLAAASGVTLRGVNVVDAAGWLAVAIETPANSTRREATAALTQRPMTALLTQLKRALDTKLTSEAKERQIRQRREEKDVAHGTLPMLFPPSALASLREIAATAESAPTFRAAFERVFAAQLVLSEGVFVAGKKAGSKAEFEAAVGVALTNLFEHRAQLRDVFPVSCTHLPKRGCAHVTCPEFMQRQSIDLFQHLADRGCDLPNKHPSRDFVPSFHMHGWRLYNANNDRAIWTAAMRAHTANIIAPERMPAYHYMIDILYPLIQQLYC
jgi:hypothetical protein